MPFLENLTGLTSFFIFRQDGGAVARVSVKCCISHRIQRAKQRYGLIRFWAGFGWVDAQRSLKTFSVFAWYGRGANVANCPAGGAHVTGTFEERDEYLIVIVGYLMKREQGVTREPVGTRLFHLGVGLEIVGNRNQQRDRSGNLERK